MLNIYKNKKSVFYVDSPFQLLQFYEYKTLFDVQNYHLIVRLNGSVENDRQLTELIKLFEIDSVSTFDMSNRFKVCVGLALLFFPFLNASHVFIGDANSIVFKAYRYVVPTAKVVLFDDGVATLFDEHENSIYTRFSLFSSKIKNGIKNDFISLREFLNVDAKKDVNIVVGGKLVEEGICSKEAYFGLLEKMLDNLRCSGGDEVVYIAHRGEASENLKEIGERFSITIKRLNYPIELVGAELDINPVTISTVVSTAVFSMSKIYEGTKVFLFRPDESDLMERKAVIVKLFEYFEDYAVGDII